MTQSGTREVSPAGLTAIALAAALWAVSAAVAASLFARGVEPLELAASRAVIAFAGFGIISLALRDRASDRGSAIPHVVALGLAIALVNAAYYLAIDHLAVAIAIVLQYTAPAFLVAYTALRRRRRPTPQVLGALGLALAGVLLASEIPGGDLGNLDLLGILFGLSSGVLFATYTMVSERVGATYGPIGGMLRAFGVASLFWVATQSFRGWPAELFEARNIPLILFVGLMGTLAPFLLYVWAVSKVPPERAAIAATLEPALAGLVAFVWLDQGLSAMQIAGGVLVLGAVVLLQARRKKRIVGPEP